MYSGRMMLVVSLVVVNVSLLGYAMTRETPAASAAAPDRAFRGARQLHLLSAADRREASRRECRVWGPERSPEDFEDLVAQLRATGGAPEINEVTVDGPSDYLVYVGDLGSAAAAKRMSQELTGLEIESFVITRGNAPAISVGVFSRRNLAVAQRDKLRDLGYDAVMDVLVREQKVYNLVAHIAIDSDAYQSSVSTCAAIAEGY
jgi:hypothetical protein